MTSVYLGGLPRGISERELRGHLEIYGRLNALSISDKGYAFVEYESQADAKDIVDSFAGRPFMGYDIRIELARKARRQTTIPSPTLVIDRNDGRAHGNDRPFVRFPVVVYNLNPRTCWQELKDFGRIAGGDPVYCDIDRSDRTRGYLEFYSQEAADQFVRRGNGRELLNNVVELYALGRQKLRPEHGPPSRSPSTPHRRRHSSASTSVYSRPGRSRSRSPVPSHCRQYNRSPSSPKHSSGLLPSIGRRDIGDRRHSYDDQYNDPRGSSPRHEQHDWPTARSSSTENLRLNTTYSEMYDYTDTYGGHHACTDKLEAQWREYSDYPLNSQAPQND